MFLVLLSYSANKLYSERCRRIEFVDQQLFLSNKVIFSCHRRCKRRLVHLSTMADLSPDDLDVLMRGLRELREINKAHLARLRARFPGLSEDAVRALVDDGLRVLKD